MSTSEPLEPGHSDLGALLSVGATAVTLVALAVASLWLVSPGGILPGTQQAPSGGRDEPGEDRRTEASPAVSAREAVRFPVYVYLVGSKGLAEALHQSFRADDEPGRERVVLIVEPAAQDRLLEVLKQDDAIQHGLGRAGLMVIDLRARTGGMSSDCTADVHEPSC
jgi:hypothetical protein